MKKITEHVTLDREELLTIPAQEIVTRLDNWVTNRFDKEKFYAHFRWEVNCKYMDACAVDNVGRAVFFIKLD